MNMISDTVDFFSGLFAIFCFLFAWLIILPLMLFIATGCIETFDDDGNAQEATK